MAVFDRAADGTLTQKPRPGGLHLGHRRRPLRRRGGTRRPVSVTVSPDGPSVYVASAGSGAVAVFDRAPNGRLTQKPGAAGASPTPEPASASTGGRSTAPSR